MPDLPPPPTTGFRFRFSLRTLLIGTVLIGFVAAWYGAEWNRIRRQRATVQKLHANNVSVDWDYQRPDGITIEKSAPPPGSQIMRALFGDEAGAYVDTAYLLNIGDRTDACLALLPNFPKLKTIVIGSAMTPESPRLIARNPQLAELYIIDAKISADGLAELNRLLQLKHLHLSSNEIGDDELRGVEQLPRLEYLNLSATKVTSQGLKHLRNLTQLRELDLRTTVVADDGLDSLQGLAELENLTVGPNVTEAAAKNLQQRLPNCEIRGYTNLGMVIFELKRGS